ncbi:Ig-like domain-containing protein [Thalassomonas haliotis]|uniref:Ig-like domain-containing protein n=1 Tax=Thalassomonas haliotis TaxID=485448 RepID=A0ABY7VKZ8_9GAMM|nr:Ig-like domain-containing protein [Thalassomonas haliotis]WDE14281.1 Ig-like domain-containing protein [Thalassomonas haliotis]
MIYLQRINKLKWYQVLARSAVLVLLSACNKGQKDSQAGPINQAPQVMAQAFSSQTEVVIRDKLVAQDPESQALRFTLVRAPALGQIFLAADGSFHYIPNEETTGSDSFTFNVSDGVNPEVSARATIVITALRVNLSTFSRYAFTQQENDAPLKVNGRVFIDDIDSSEFYADLFVF